MEKRKDIRQLIIDAAEQYNDRTAFIYNDKEFDFNTLKNDSFRLANALLDLGLKKGDKIAIYLPNCIEYVYSYYAIYSLGCIAIPLDFYLSANELISIAKHCDLSAIITTSKAKFDLSELKDSIPTLQNIITIEDKTNYIYFWDLINTHDNNLNDQNVTSDMISSIFYTSGVTGRPKGALWNYEHIQLTAEQLKFFTTNEELKGIINFDENERIIAAIPFSHSAGIFFPMTAIKYGVSSVIMPQFHPLQLVKLIDKWQVTGVFMVPPMYYAVLYLKDIDKFSLNSLRWATVFGAPSSPDLMRKFEKLCPNAIVINSWGMTEVIPPVCASSPSNIRSVGKPVPNNVELKIVDPDGNEVKVGEVGELIVRGKSVFVGYYNEPELNNEVFKNGWFYTGDLARKDEEGNYYIIGKSKDTIKVGGQLVWAAEVEEVLLRYPGIREAAAIGVPDELRGEVVKCYIAPVDSIDLDKNELMEYLRNNLAKFKLPKDIIILNELPKTGSGKVNKAALQEFN